MLLSKWSGLACPPLHESDRGPRWPGLLEGTALDISLSYGAGEIWIGLRRGGAIGVDVMSPATMDDMPAVARLYLGNDTEAAIRQSADPALEFAGAWTRREAHLKCLKLGLTEWPPLSARAEAGCLTETVLSSPTLVGSLAWT